MKNSKVLQGWRSRILLWGIILTASIFAVLFAVTEPNSARALTTVPTKMNFQGRITNTSGNILANGSYNMRFKIYDSPSGGTLQWSENRLVSATQGVYVDNGQFSVQLGEISSLPASIFSSNSLYFEVELPTPATATSSSPSWTEGPMTPRNLLATSAYAYNAETLDGIDSASFAQLGTANAFTGANSVNVANANAFQVKNGSTNLFNADTTNSIVSIGTTDANGTVLQLDVKNTAGDPTGAAATNGAMYYNSVNDRFRCFESGSWGDCQLHYDLQDVYDNAWTATADITTSSATKVLSITAGVAPTSSLFSVSNAGQAVTTSDANAVDVNFVGGAAAVEAAGVKVDLTPGGTSGGTWNGMRIVANPTGAASGVSENGIKIEGPTSPGSGTETGMYIGTGWDTGLDVQSGGLNLAAYTSGGNPADPPTPAGDNLRVYAKKISGRMLLKIKGSSGVDNPLQPALFGNNIIMYTPTSGTTVTGGFGTLWAKGSSGGTVSTPTPASTAPAISNQMHRTRHLNVTLTTNQSMGIRANSADAFQFWGGNGSGLGGYFFMTRFIVEAYPASTVRLFAGLSASATEATASDTVQNNTVGLWHDTTDASTRLSLVTKNATTATKTAINLSNAIAAGNSYDWFMYMKPNDTTIYYRLDDLVNGVSYEGNTSTTLPVNTAFMAPQVEMGNASNTTANTVGIGVNRIYIESDR